MGKITLTHAQTGQVWGPFEKPTVIGRDAQCDLPLPGRMVSKLHCKLEPSGNGWALVDLESTNGTFIDAERITRARVTDGETIAVGDVPLRLSIQSASTRPASTAPAIIQPAPIQAASIPPAATSARPITSAPAAPLSRTKTSLWEEAKTAAEIAAAAPKKQSTRSLRSLTEGKSKIAVIAALVAVILFCAAWSAYYVLGRSSDVPRVPRQLAPIDGDPSV